ncbi:MAG: hypothetical protein K0A95_04585 [Chromatiales bacterium]|nr:hypothetical protein [Gammaproteobacteria bacterium]MBW6476330.1 hypothetical protein [Chromatiales bacterium]
MRSRPVHLRGNTRALLVGFSLLLMASTAAELRQHQGSEPLQQTAALASDAVRYPPLMREQILTGLALLQMGYSEQELSRYFAQLESASPHLSSGPASHALNSTPVVSLHLHPVSLEIKDLRSGMAQMIPSLPSGSSPVFL